MEFFSVAFAAKNLGNRRKTAGPREAKSYGATRDFFIPGFADDNPPRSSVVISGFSSRRPRICEKCRFC
jgi:hypothetical protein